MTIALLSKNTNIHKVVSMQTFERVCFNTATIGRIVNDDEEGSQL